MKRVSLFAAALLLTLAIHAEERGYWRAASNSARNVTGDISLGDEKLTINFSTTTISKVRPLEPTEVSSVFDTDSAAAGTGSFYRVNIPAAKKFLHKNTLCGSDDTQWLATYVQGRSLRVALFSGADMPVLTADALANSTDVCGTFSYSR